MSQHAVRAANEAFYAVFERLDFEAMAKLWARGVDVSCVHPGWDLVLGYEAVMQSWRAIFDGSTEMRFRIEEAHVTAGSDKGWVVCREILSTNVQGMPVENVLTTINVFVLEHGEWRMAHHHSGPLLAGKPRNLRPPDTLLH